MSNTNDKVLKAYKNVVNAVGVYVDSHDSDFETSGLELVMISLEDMGKLYGVDIPAYVEVIRENNDIPALAEALCGDDLVYVRITGTLSQGVADLASCIYDVDASLQMVEVLGRFVSAVLVIQEFENA